MSNIPKGKKRKVPVKEHRRRVPKGVTTVKEHTRQIRQKDIKQLQLKVDKLKLKDELVIESIVNLERADRNFEIGSVRHGTSFVDSGEDYLEASSAYNLTFKKKYDSIKGEAKEIIVLEKKIADLELKISDLTSKQKIAQLQEKLSDLTEAQRVKAREIYKELSISQAELQEMKRHRHIQQMDKKITELEKLSKIIPPETERFKRNQKHLEKTKERKEKESIPDYEKINGDILTDIDNRIWKEGELSSDMIHIYPFATTDFLKHWVSIPNKQRDKLKLSPLEKLVTSKRY